MTNIRASIADLIFPRRCLGCDVLLEDTTPSNICFVCISKIPGQAGFSCAFCSSPTRAGQTCPFCIKDRYLNRLFAFTNYENILVKKLIKTMKYQFVYSLANVVGNLMSPYFKKNILNTIEPSNTIVIPVPLHKKRLNWRGFNQSELIARSLSANLGLNINSSIIKRTSNTRHQADIKNRLERINNIQGSFCSIDKNKTIPNNITSEKQIILIDDVSTTSYTLNDCARALKGAGAKEVIGFVFARGRP